MRKLRSEMSTLLIGISIGHLVGTAPMSDYQQALFSGITTSVLAIGICITYWVEAYEKT